MDHMVKTVILMLPGTGHPNGGDGITESFLGYFDRAHFDARIVPYAAAFGGTDMPFALSRETGRKALMDALDSVKGTPVVLAGYSQGAVIAGDLALELSRVSHLTHNIKAVALIADGYRPIGVGVVPTGNSLAEGYGICGQRPVPDTHFPTLWVSAWGDPISALPAGNPLRTVADMVGWFSIRSIEDAVKWGAVMLSTAVTGRMQTWWNPLNWGKWNSAIGFAKGYLTDEHHGMDYAKYGYTRALARTVVEITQKKD
jgi:pimeloyl-ACP methyl ester carboxylesterase